MAGNPVYLDADVVLAEPHFGVEDTLPGFPVVVFVEARYGLFRGVDCCLAIAEDDDGGGMGRVTLDDGLGLYQGLLDGE